MTTKAYLEKLAPGFNTKEDFDSVMAVYDVREIAPYLRGKTLLELGTSAGTVTKHLLPYAEILDIVEGSETGIKRTKELLDDGEGKIGYIHELWEEFKPEKLYTDIISIRSLEHAEDPSSLLNQMGDWLTENGRIHIIVPNANSLHRHVMVHQGKLSDLYALRDRDYQVGHVQVFDKDHLENAVKGSGLKVAHSTDFFVKSVGTSEMGDITRDPENPFVKSCYDAGIALHKQGIYGLGTQLYVVAEKE